MSQRLAADMAGRAPEFVGRYEVLLPIASGGMATVYLARSVGVRGFEREVALKLTHAHLRENRDFAMDLIEEAKISVRIRHPNVVSVLDAGEDPTGLFLVMDYVEGDTLASLSKAAERRGGSLPPRVGMRILVDALAGLHAAHELRDESGRVVGLVHRDFSPQNILVCVDGTARLSDFGIAKAATRLGHTTTGIVKGKLAYLSPEQARAQPLDRRSDVWAAGVVAWEILTGRRLFDAENEAATLLRIVSERPVSVRSVNPELPIELDRTIAQALEPDRQQRCPSASALGRQLASAAQDHDLLADLDEVAHYVRDVVEIKLERRRRKIRDVLDHRSRSAESEASRPRIAAQQSSAAIEGASEISGESGSVHSGIRARGAEVSSKDTLIDGPRKQAADLVVVDQASRRPAGWIAAASMAALIVVVVAALRLVSFAAPAQGDPAAAFGSATAATPPSSGLPQASASMPLSNSATALGFEFITISADAPIRSLLVEGQEIPVAPSSRSLSVQVTFEALSRGVSVEATAADGRVVRAISEARQHTLLVRFPAGRVGGGTTAGAATGKLPFAPNPYASTQR